MARVGIPSVASSLVAIGATRVLRAIVPPGNGLGEAMVTCRGRRVEGGVGKPPSRAAHGHGEEH